MASRTGNINDQIARHRLALDGVDLEKETKKVFKIIDEFATDPSNPAFHRKMKMWRDYLIAQQQKVESLRKEGS